MIERMKAKQPKQKKEEERINVFCISIISTRTSQQRLTCNSSKKKFFLALALGQTSNTREETKIENLFDCNKTHTHTTTTTTKTKRNNAKGFIC